MKVLLIILDGLNYSVAAKAMGYLQALCRAKVGKLYRLECQLPSLSRPLYECILTGVTPVKSGIVNNSICRLSTNKSIFHYAKEAGLTTAAAAYHWVSELYNRTPFDKGRDRIVHDSSLPIQHASFYWQDNYPDSHLIADGNSLILQHKPDLVLIHSMNIDDAGHHYGLDSRNYRNAARSVDLELANYLSNWLALGYQILITADHGMNNDLSHGGCLEEETQIPLFVFGDVFSHSAEAQPEQFEICGTICAILQIPHQTRQCSSLLKELTNER